MLGQLAAHLLQHLVHILGLHLVGLGQHSLEGNRRAVQQAQDVFIDRLHPMARINQHEGPAQRRAACKISFEQSLPFLDHRQRGIGKAIARQIDEIVLCTQCEIVDLLGAAGRIGGPRKPLPACQCVDQCGFAHI